MMFLHVNHNTGFGHEITAEDGETYLVVHNCNMGPKGPDGKLTLLFYFGVKKSDVSPAPVLHLITGPVDLHLQPKPALPGKQETPS